MEIKNSLLNEPEFKYLKESLIQASEVDHKEEWRIKLIEYLDSVSSNEDDEYFFDSIEFSRFLIPDDHTTAYTDQNMLIWMNAPGVFGENRKYWDFIFCHECLHQLWDTFGVGDKLKNEGIEYFDDEEVLELLLEMGKTPGDRRRMAGIWVCILRCCLMR